MKSIFTVALAPLFAVLLVITPLKAAQIDTQTYYRSVSELRMLRESSSPLLNGGMGVLVNLTTPGSQGDGVGILPGDIIVSYDGNPIRGVNWTQLPLGTPASQVVKVGIVRQGKKHEFKVRGGRLGVGFGLYHISSEPMLRIDTEGHLGPVVAVSTDDAGKYLLTASTDQSLRLWSMANGQQVQVYRPPFGLARETAVSTGKISPNAKYVVSGGLTTDAALQIYDRKSGELIHKIAGFQGVNDICFSKDSELMALVHRDGIALLSTNEFQKIGVDDAYGATAARCDFSALGYVATTSMDGQVRLYDSKLSLLRKVATSEGRRPFGVAFDKDGKRLAVGFYDSTNIKVLDGLTLSPLYKPDVSSINRPPSFVSWGRDGSLWAGGSAWIGNEVVTYRWSNGGMGEREAISVADNVIMAISAVPDGSIVLGTSSPGWSLLDENGGVIFRKKTPLQNMRWLVKDNRLFASKRADYVYLNLDSPIAFDLDRLAVSREEITNPQSTKLSPPLKTATGFALEGFSAGARLTEGIRLNGHLLPFTQNLTYRSYAIQDKDRSLVLASDYGLQAFKFNGEHLWNRPLGTVAWGVTVSEDGAKIIAGLGDGTIRWYRTSDGQELLSLFVDTESDRWVAWTPSGYYAASPGGDRLIGWHKNSGPDEAAQFYPASLLRSRFYQPEVVSSILTTLDEDRSLEIAGIKHRQDLEESLPPVVTLLSPLEGHDFNQAEVTIKYRVSSQDGKPVSAVRVLVDGRPLSTERGLQIESKDTRARTLKVTLPGRDIQLSVIAENSNGASSPASVHLKWVGETQEQFVIKPKLYVLAVGVSDYLDDALDLEFAAKDAVDFANAMREQGGGLYREVVVKALADATSDELLDGLDWLRAEVTSKDVAMLFLAGHGVNDADGDYYYLTSDVNIDRLRRTAIPYYDVKKTLSSLSGKTLAFIDTCHSGNIMGARRGVADITAVVNDLTSAENGVVVFASSTGKQYSLENDEWGNGAFTKALVEGLSGQADYTGDGTITINQLDLYLAERVKKLTGNQQTPTTTKPQTVSDFPIAVK